MARDYNKDYDNPEMTWDKYHKTLNDEGMSDDQIKQELTGTKWDTQGKEYGKWRDGIPVFVQDTPEATKKYIDANPTSAMVPNEQPKVEAPVEEQTTETPVEQPTADDIMKETRKQYANDNEGYKKALADKGIETGDSRSKVRSIQQAYYDGLIDKGTRDYMMADAIAKFARNTGRDIGNIGAQYTGGTINNNYEEADWNKRNDELFKQQTSSEAADVKGSDAEMKRAEQQANLTGQKLGNEKASRAQEFSRRLEEEANKAYADGNTAKGDALMFAASKGALNLSYDDLVLLEVLKDSRDPEIKRLVDSGNADKALEKRLIDTYGDNWKELIINGFKEDYDGLDDSNYNEAVQLFFNEFKSQMSAGVDVNNALNNAGDKVYNFLRGKRREKKNAEREAAKKAKAPQEAEETRQRDEAMINAAM